MTPAASVSFFRPEFDDFLYAPIGTDRNEMPLSVLSALARLDIDPWEKAAELSELPKDIATQKLASLIARLPGGQWTQVDSKGISHRLIELLPRPSIPKVPLTEIAHGLPKMKGSLKMVICAALGGIAPSLQQAANLRRGLILLTRRPSTQSPRRRCHGRVTANDDHLSGQPSRKDHRAGTSCCGRCRCALRTEIDRI